MMEPCCLILARESVTVGPWVVGPLIAVQATALATTLMHTQPRPPLFQWSKLMNGITLGNEFISGRLPFLPNAAKDS